jgi:hypothetical protein
MDVYRQPGSFLFIDGPVQIELRGRSSCAIREALERLHPLLEIAIRQLTQQEQEQEQACTSFISPAR